MYLCVIKKPNISGSPYFCQVSVCIYVDVECIGYILYPVSCILNNVEFRMHRYVSCKVYSVILMYEIYSM